MGTSSVIYAVWFRKTMHVLKAGSEILGPTTNYPKRLQLLPEGSATLTQKSVSGIDPNTRSIFTNNLPTIMFVSSLPSFWRRAIGCFPRFSHKKKNKQMLWFPLSKLHVQCTSDVRHPRCVLYNSKELSVVIHTVKHNYITSIIVTMRVLTTTCFGPTCGPSSGCN